MYVLLFGSSVVIPSNYNAINCMGISCYFRLLVDKWKRNGLYYTIFILPVGYADKVFRLVGVVSNGDKNRCICSV